MSDLHETRIKRLSLPIVLLLHILGIAVGGSAFFIIGVIAAAAFGIHDTDSGVLLALAIAVFGALLPSFFIRKARRRSAAAPQPLVPSARGKPPNGSGAEGPRSGKGGLVALASLLGVMAVALLWAFQSEMGKSLIDEIARGDHIPKCDASITADTIRKMAKSAPTSKLINIEIFAVKDAKELAWSEQSQIRRCTARVFTNAGTDDLNFRIYWIDRAKGEFYVETE